MHSKIRTKDDIEFHGGKPAVNVKVDTYLRHVKLPICLGGVSTRIGSQITWQYTEPEFTAEWVEENLDYEAIQFYFDNACEEGWQQLQDLADAIWLETWYAPKVWSEGRSGGWAVVDGLPDVEDWNAVMLSKWRRFAKYAREVADDVPTQVMTTIYLNRWEKV